jgi:hypothetical protein
MNGVGVNRCKEYNESDHKVPFEVRYAWADHLPSRDEILSYNLLFLTL